MEVTESQGSNRLLGGVVEAHAWSRWGPVCECGGYIFWLWWFWSFFDDGIIVYAHGLIVTECCARGATLLWKVGAVPFFLGRDGQGDRELLKRKVTHQLLPGTSKWRFAALRFVHSQDIREIRGPNAFKIRLKCTCHEIALSVTRQTCTWNCPVLLHRHHCGKNRSQTFGHHKKPHPLKQTLNREFIWVILFRNEKQSKEWVSWKRPKGTLPKGTAGEVKF